MGLVYYCILKVLTGKDKTQECSPVACQYPEAQKRDLDNILTSKKPVYTRTGK